MATPLTLKHTAKLLLDSVRVWLGPRPPPPVEPKPTPSAKARVETVWTRSSARGASIPIVEPD